MNASNNTKRVGPNLAVFGKRFKGDSRGAMLSMIQSNITRLPFGRGIRFFYGDSLLSISMGILISGSRFLKWEKHCELYPTPCLYV